MEFGSINTRADIDLIIGTSKHSAVMALLEGTLWRVEKDDAAQVWVAIEDNSTIERFGFTRADFPSALPPVLPKYVPSSEESDKARAELIAIDLASIRSIREWVAAQPDAPQILKDREAAAVTARAKIK